MDSSKSKRVVLYCRVATQAQLDGDHALEAQSARMHEQGLRQSICHYNRLRTSQ